MKSCLKSPFFAKLLEYCTDNEYFLNHKQLWKQKINFIDEKILKTIIINTNKYKDFSKHSNSNVLHPVILNISAKTFEALKANGLIEDSSYKKDGVNFCVFVTEKGLKYFVAKREKQFIVITKLCLPIASLVIATIALVLSIVCN